VLEHGHQAADLLLAGGQQISRALQGLAQAPVLALHGRVQLARALIGPHPALACTALASGRFSPGRRTPAADRPDRVQVLLNLAQHRAHLAHLGPVPSAGAGGDIAPITGQATPAIPAVPGHLALQQPELVMPQFAWFCQQIWPVLTTVPTDRLQWLPGDGGLFQLVPGPGVVLHGTHPLDSATGSGA